MAKFFIAGILLLFISVLLALSGCEKERIVESKEYIHEIEYVELPADTVFHVDTVFTNDSITIYAVDTLVMYDTVTQTNYIVDTFVMYDTVEQTIYVVDTLIMADTVVQVTYITDTLFMYDTVVEVSYVYDTVHVTDTITNVEVHYDTTFISDTVQLAQCTPNELLATLALQYHSDPIVFDVINQAVGYTGGFVYYLSTYQMDFTRQSFDVYDIYGYIDYWAPGWIDFYAFEFFWRVTYISGDPVDPRNWQLSEPPGYAPDHQPGIRMTTDAAETKPSR